MLVEMRYIQFEMNYTVSRKSHNLKKSIDIPFAPAENMLIQTGDVRVLVRDVRWDDNINKFIINVDANNFANFDEWTEVDTFD